MKIDKLVIWLIFSASDEYRFAVMVVPINTHQWGYRWYLALLISTTTTVYYDVKALLMNTHKQVIVDTERFQWVSTT